MLELCDDYESVRSGWVVAELLKQLDTVEKRHTFTRLMIRAALELSIVTFFGRRHPDTRVTEVTESRWRIDDLHYLYLPDVDDDARRVCRWVARRANAVTILVPCNHTATMRTVLKSGRWPCDVVVHDIESFADWRGFTAAGDANWSCEQVIRFLISTYNDFVRERQLDDTILIRLPSVVDAQ